MDTHQPDRGFPAEGTVIEILERSGQRFARILIDQGAVLELPAGAHDIQLGDRVVVDATLTITPGRGGPAVAAPPTRATASTDAAGGAPVRASFADYQHVLRLAGVFALAIAAFLAWRWWMVPSDFGTYGHYRAGAIADAATRPSHYAGQAACVTCHDDVRQVRATGRHAQIACEACHGALGPHARGETDAAPIRPSSRGVCLTCHTARLGMPAAFPKVIVNEHSEAGPCTDCHKSHAPGFQ
jgi:hypothetical protein